jgi:hypothetical protein
MQDSKESSPMGDEKDLEDLADVGTASESHVLNSATGTQVAATSQAEKQKKIVSAILSQFHR